ncbi:hypothetical protein M9H77_07730 [Catharanthus roseus]|uniref:Uncharacterized protein n=1 Tax=Catharanthus roseus TaxID=4058 RepID=A0ACC0BVU0_CATRO|nr:hypothetical protein M9H77_07730 [Catharanthus roseus]
MAVDKGTVAAMAMAEINLATIIVAEITEREEETVVKPQLQHWEAALQVVHYLKSYLGEGIFLSSTSNLTVTAYCDADWATYPVTRRSFIGYFIFLGNSPVSRKEKMQPTISCSSAEAEYWSMVVTCCELKRLR